MLNVETKTISPFLGWALGGKTNLGVYVLHR